MIYNRVKCDLDDYVKGMLFTDKELKKENIPEMCLEKVSVLSYSDIYWFFGARFSEKFVRIVL